MAWNGCDFQRTQTNPFTHRLNYSTLPYLASRFSPHFHPPISACASAAGTGELRNGGTEGAALRQVERPHQEYRHLRPRDRVLRAVIAAAAAGGDALVVQLLDPLPAHQVAGLGPSDPNAK